MLLDSVDRKEKTMYDLNNTARMRRKINGLNKRTVINDPKVHGRGLWNALESLKEEQGHEASNEQYLKMYDKYLRGGEDDI
jgi:hypothetical protein